MRETKLSKLSLLSQQVLQEKKLSYMKDAITISCTSLQKVLFQKQQVMYNNRILNYDVTQRKKHWPNHISKHFGRLMMSRPRQKKESLLYIDMYKSILMYRNLRIFWKKYGLQQTITLQFFTNFTSAILKYFVPYFDGPIVKQKRISNMIYSYIQTIDQNVTK